MMDAKQLQNLEARLCEQAEATYKGNLTDLRRIFHLSLAKGNPK
jgi:hypothetical protein